MGALLIAGVDGSIYNLSAVAGDISHQEIKLR
jgi:hypothetical protein